MSHYGSETTLMQGSSSSVRKKVSNYWFISYLFSNTAYGLTIPLIPLFVVMFLKSGVVWDGIVYSLASAASVPALLFWGNLSDSIKKRKIFVIIGFLGAGIALIPIFLVHTLGVYILFLIVAQVVGMASVPVSNLLIFESTQQSQWPNVMATFNMIASTGTVLGLAIGAVMVVLYGSGVDSVIPLFYLVAGAIYILAVISAMIILKEPSRNINRAKLGPFYSLRVIERVRYFPSSVIHIISDRKMKALNKLSPPLRHYIYASSFLMFGFQLFILAFPVYVIQNVGGTTEDIFYLYLINAIFSTLTFRFAGNYIRLKGGKKTLTMSLASRFITFGAAAFLPYIVMQSTQALMVSMIIYAVVGAFWGFISIGQISFVSDNAQPKQRGRAVGYYNSFFGFGQIGGSFISGVISEYVGYSADFAVSSLIVLAGTVLILRYYPHIRIITSDPDSVASTDSL